MKKFVVAVVVLVAWPFVLLAPVVLPAPVSAKEDGRAAATARYHAAVAELVSAVNGLAPYVKGNDKLSRDFVQSLDENSKRLADLAAQVRKNMFGPLSTLKRRLYYAHNERIETKRRGSLVTAYVSLDLPPIEGLSISLLAAWPGPTPSGPPFSTVVWVDRVGEGWRYREDHAVLFAVGGRQIKPKTEHEGVERGVYVAERINFQLSSEDLVALVNRFEVRGRVGIDGITLSSSHLATFHDVLTRGQKEKK